MGGHPAQCDAVRIEAIVARVDLSAGGDAYRRSAAMDAEFVARPDLGAARLVDESLVNAGF